MTTALPPFNVMDTTIHALGTRGILNWMLWRWSLHPQANLMVVTDRLASNKLDNNLRVILSGTRKGMKRAGHDDMIQFGIHSKLILWENEFGMTCEALFLTRIVNVRHTILEAIAQKGK